MTNEDICSAVCSKAERWEPKDKLMVNPLDFAAFVSVLGAKTQHNPNGVQFVGVHTRRGTVTIMPDPDCPRITVEPRT
jgi:hypothetical protein